MMSGLSAVELMRRSVALEPVVVRSTIASHLFELPSAFAKL